MQTLHGVESACIFCSISWGISNPSLKLTRAPLPSSPTLPPYAHKPFPCSPARPVAWQVNRFFRHATSSPATPYWANALRRLAHLTAGSKDSLSTAPSLDGQSIKEHFFRVALGVPLAMCRHHTTPQSCRVAIDSKVRPFPP